MANKNTNNEAIHSILSSEYANLQAARGIVNGEISTRVSHYFTILSSVMVSSAFLAQLSIDNLVFQVFLSLAVPTLIILGILTMGKVIQLGMHDMAYIKAINRIRHNFVKVYPEIEDILFFPPYDDRKSLYKFGGYFTNFMGNLMSAGASIIFINSIVSALFLGLVLGGKYDLSAPHYVGLLIICYGAHSLVSAYFAKQYARPELLESRFPAPDSEEHQMAAEGDQA